MNSSRERRVPLVGYTDRLSARAGDTIEFKLSATGHDDSNPALVKSWLTHCISADPNPSGPGIIERSAERWYQNSDFSVTEQAIHAGSCGISPAISLTPEATDVRLQVTLWPTLLNGSEQCILSFGALSLCINTDNVMTCKVGKQAMSLTEPLTIRQWVYVEARLQRKGAAFEITLQQQTVTANGSTTISTNPLRMKSDNNSRSKPITPAGKTFVISANSVDEIITFQHEVGVAAQLVDGIACHHFNGKLEAPAIHAANSHQKTELSLCWDLAVDMHSRSIPDQQGHVVPLFLRNYPARAMAGSQWNGDEMCWRHSLSQYGAIHFHEDDIVDFEWQTTFSYTLPEGMPSGIYLMHISDGTHEDAMPFFVCAPKGEPGHRICMLVPGFTYAIYGNHARPDWKPGWQNRVEQWKAYPYNPAQYPGYGLSTYNYHSDGSGICHASHARPLFNLRPGYITFGESDCSGLRHFPADSHLWAWLDAMNLGFDVITDRELHNEGAQCIDGYDVLLTSSHPEYHTAQTLDALQQYRDKGGHLSYLGGNGFYWRIGIHSEQDDVLEIRRAEAGIRAWASEPGEYYQAFDGQYGGLWRRNGRPPQKLCGLGFSAQGEFNGSYYRRVNREPAFDWIFNGIDTDILGDFGLSGGGAAGFELDRADTHLGTPPLATILATSENHGEDFILVPEEMLTHLTTLPGPPTAELLHANIIWFDVQGGGSVFAVGSITFCGSLPHNQFENPISRLLLNVVQHVIAD